MCTTSATCMKCDWTKARWGDRLKYDLTKVEKRNINEMYIMTRKINGTSVQVGWLCHLLAEFDCLFFLSFDCEFIASFAVKLCELAWANIGWRREFSSPRHYQKKPVFTHTYLLVAPKIRNKDWDYVSFPLLSTAVCTVYVDQK